MSKIRAQSRGQPRSPINIGPASLIYSKGTGPALYGEPSAPSLWNIMGASRRRMGRTLSLTGIGSTTSSGTYVHFRGCPTCYNTGSLPWCFPGGPSPELVGRVRVRRRWRGLIGQSPQHQCVVRFIQWPMVAFKLHLDGRLVCWAGAGRRSAYISAVFAGKI